jgi:hypothetical protein
MQPDPLDPQAPFEVVIDALKKSERDYSITVANAYQTRLQLTRADFFALGVARRATALSAGFRAMVDQRKSLCALPIVRMQLDTALRLYAGFFAPDHRAFCRRVMDGDRIDRIKADDGQRMNDKYLCRRVAQRNPWMNDVYELTSGYVHLSERHISAVLDRTDELGPHVALGTMDRREPRHFHEPARCMVHLGLIINHALMDWLDRMCGDDEFIGAFKAPMNS